MFLKQAGAFDLRNWEETKNIDLLFSIRFNLTIRFIQRISIATLTFGLDERKKDFLITFIKITKEL